MAIVDPPPLKGLDRRYQLRLGSVMQAYRKLTMYLVAAKDAFVLANFKETQLAKVHPGQKAEIRVEMYGKAFPGRVDSVSASTGSKLSLLPPENASGNFVKVTQRMPVKIVLDPIPPEIVLRPGMSVTATIFVR